MPRRVDTEEHEYKGQKLLFCGSVDPSLICSICFNILDAPCCTNCGHSFCRGCLQKWLSGSSTCPTCRSHIGSSVPPTNIALNGLIGNIKVLCPTPPLADGKRCKETVTLDTLASHVKDECQFVKVKCTNCAASILRRDLDTHCAVCFFKCPHSIRGCVFKGNDATVLNHLKSCPFELCLPYIKKLEDALTQTDPGAVKALQLTSAPVDSAATPSAGWASGISHPSVVISGRTASIPADAALTNRLVFPDMPPVGAAPTSVLRLRITLGSERYISFGLTDSTAAANYDLGRSIVLGGCPVQSLAVRSSGTVLCSPMPAAKFGLPQLKQHMDQIKAEKSGSTVCLTFTRDRAGGTLELASADQRRVLYQMVSNRFDLDNTRFAVYMFSPGDSVELIG